MSPTRKSPSGTRAAAISISSAEASIPATLAPRSAAMRAKRPAPHPQSSTRLPEPILARSSTCSYAGVPQPAEPSHVAAHAAARAPNSGPQRVALPPAASGIADTSSACVRPQDPTEAPHTPSDRRIHGHPTVRIRCLREHCIDLHACHSRLAGVASGHIAAQAARATRRRTAEQTLLRPNRYRPSLSRTVSDISDADR